jgi:hypothetical protein
MYLPTDSESEIEKIGGDPLNGSGFESEKPDLEFESDALSSEEDILQ